MAKTDTTPTVTTKSLHRALKDVMARELAQLPDLLEALPPAERIKAVLQLLPYTAPKVEQCSSEYGDGFGWD
jgi:hypothetical protein